MNLALLRQVVPLLTGEFTLATLKQLRQDPVLGEYFLAHYGNGPENQIFDVLLIFPVNIYVKLVSTNI